MLHKLGAHVKGYSLAPKSSDDLYPSIQGDELCESVIADIRDKDRLKKELHDFQPDFVFHLAAQALVIDSYKWPVDTYETNVLGTIYLMDALRSLDKRCVSVLITTDKVYENFETHEPYAEDARIGGYDPYSNSKACCELAISSYRNCFFNPAEFENHQQAVASARSGNVIGGGDWSENRLVPDIARALINEQPVLLRNPMAVRPWQHVLDPLHGYLTLAAKLDEDPQRHATGYNFGPQPEDERTVLDMTKISIDAWGNGSYETPELTEQPHEAGLLKLAIDKANAELNWQPAFRSEEAVAWTMRWYKDGRKDARNYTTNQIEEFLSRS